MKLNLSLEECKNLSREGAYGVIPLATEIYGDAKTPIEILRILKRVSRHVYLLESADSQKRWSRYSFLGFDPVLEISCRNGETKVKTALTTQVETKDVKSCIREILSDNKSPILSDLPGFTGGLVGYFSYDYIKYAEPTLKLDAKDEEGFSDVNLMLFHKVVAFDHFRQKVILITNVKTDDLEINYNKALLELDTMSRLITDGERAKAEKVVLKSEFKSLFSKEEYCNMVERGKHYIKEGDIFQVVLSNRMEAQMEGSLLDAYRVLRTQNPSPYMFYFSGQDGEFTGASPETLVKL
ncbi:MAG: chorismate-binding protein, partial [Lachnospiraceae bacterium]|nr:chorismate-binding protein [Lachnospiraceae bacterium]